MQPTVKPIETIYNGYRFRSSMGVLADAMDPGHEVNLRHVSLGTIAHPTGWSDVTRNIAKGAVDSINAITDVRSMCAPNASEYPTRQSTAVIARLLDQGSELLGSQLKGMAALVSTFAVENKQLAECGFSRGEAIVAGEPAVGLAAFGLEATATPSRVVFEIGPTNNRLFSAVAETTPLPMPTATMELLTCIRNDGQTPVSLASVFDIGFSHETPPIAIAASIPLYGLYCQAARQARFEHGAHGR